LGDRTGLGRAMKRGEVRWYKFSKPDKRRPVVILTRNSAIEFLGELTIAPVTSTIRDIPSEVFLTEEDGMPKNCAVNLDHIQTVSKAKIGSLITTLNPARMSELWSAALFALGF
jgi:mRNA interferase MazF